MRGVWTALVTPFQKDGSIDFEAFAKLIRDQREARITGVIPCGTTGETPTLTVEEKKKLIAFTIEALKGSGVKVFAGTGTNNTAESIALSSFASDAGADGVLIVTPYYNKPSQAGLVSHFRQIADHVRCEVMLYNVPGRTVISMTPETVVALADHPRIRTIKEATGSVAFTSELIDQLRVAGRSIDILSGDDATYLPLLSVGAVGVVSVASNLFPRAMMAIQAAAQAGRFAEAMEIHQRYYPLFRDLFVDANPVPVKYALMKMGFCEPFVRSPLLELSAAHREKLEATLTRCGLKKGTPA